MMVCLCNPAMGARSGGRARTLPRVPGSHGITGAAPSCAFQTRLPQKSALPAGSAPHPAADPRPSPLPIQLLIPDPARARSRHLKSPSHGAPAPPSAPAAGLAAGARRPCPHLGRARDDPNPAAPLRTLQLGPARPRLAPPAAGAGPARAALKEPRVRPGARETRKGEENVWGRASKSPAA